MPARSGPTSPLGTPRGGPRHASLSHPVPPIADTVSAAAAVLGANTPFHQGSLHSGSGACPARNGCTSKLLNCNFDACTRHSKTARMAFTPAIEPAFFACIYRCSAPMFLCLSMLGSIKQTCICLKSCLHLHTLSTSCSVLAVMCISGLHSIHHQAKGCGRLGHSTVQRPRTHDASRKCERSCTYCDVLCRCP